MRSDQALSNSRNIIDEGEYNTPSTSPESCSGRMCGCLSMVLEVVREVHGGQATGAEFALDAVAIGQRG